MTPHPRDFYRVLGVASDASASEIRRAYARLLRKHHPDAAGDLPARLGGVQAAYRCLSDPAARAAHDRMIATADEAHRRHQQRVRHRLRRFDRHHPRQPPRRGGRHRAILLLAAVAALAVGLAFGLLG